LVTPLNTITEKVSINDANIINQKDFLGFNSLAMFLLPRNKLEITITNNPIICFIVKNSLKNIAPKTKIKISLK
jgi:hypothetical protein